MKMKVAVYNRWTGLVDWTTGLIDSYLILKSLHTYYAHNYTGIIYLPLVTGVIVPVATAVVVVVIVVVVVVGVVAFMYLLLMFAAIAFISIVVKALASFSQLASGSLLSHFESIIRR